MDNLLDIIKTDDLGIGKTRCYYTMGKTENEERQLSQFLHLVELTPLQKRCWDILLKNDFDKKDLYNKLKDIPQKTIASSLRSTRIKIKKRLEGTGFSMEPRPFVIVNENTVCKLYESGYYHQQEIADLFGVSVGFIHGILSDYKINSPKYSKYNKTYDYKTVKSEIEKEGFEMISKEYKNYHEDILVKCHLGHITKVTFSSWKNYGVRCKECSSNHVGFKMHKEYIEKNKDKLTKHTGYVYIINLYSQSESFYKIGVTSNPKGRFSGMPYKIKVVKMYKLNLYSAYHIEDFLLQKHSEWRYDPKIKFRGSTECFSQILL